MRLIVLHPEIAGRDCEDCQRHVYTPEGNRAERRGKPVPRPPKCPPPCRLSAGCPKGCPPGETGSKALSGRNWRAWSHHQECRAVGQFPDDAIVRRNAALIRLAEDGAREILRLRTWGAADG